jgi:two-component system, OmpR family, response regulator RegX3
MTATTSTPPAQTRPSILMVMHSGAFAQSLKKAFEANGLAGTLVNDEAAALAEIKTSAPALILVTRQHGRSMDLRKLRALSAVPIVAVQETDLCNEDDCVQDYERAIDLVVCSHSTREVTARVRAILRRLDRRTQATTHYTAGSLRMDLDRHEVTVAGRLVELTPKEFQILRQFIESPGRVFSRQEMLNRVWGEGYALEEHALDVHIHSLRHKIEANPSMPRAIVTVRGIGYKLRVN